MLCPSSRAPILQRHVDRLQPTALPGVLPSYTILEIVHNCPASLSIQGDIPVACSRRFVHSGGHKVTTDEVEDSPKSTAGPCKL